MSISFLIVHFVCFTSLNRVSAQKEISTLTYNASAILGPDHQYPEIVNRIKEIKVFENQPLRDLPPSSLSGSDDKADISIMRYHFEKGLSFQRNSIDPKLKEKAMNYISAVLKSILGQDSVSLQTFTLNVRPSGIDYNDGSGLHKGANIVGVLKGENYGKKDDKAFYLMAHWDTVYDCHGVDDNGGGVVAVLELARLLKKKSQDDTLPFTFYFILFDLKKSGMMGSFVYVSSSLIPSLEIDEFKVFGAYNFDMVLNYNASSKSQILKSDYDQSIILSNAEAAKEIENNGLKGDFIGIFSRKIYDDELTDAINTSFHQLHSKISLKLYNFKAPFPQLLRDFDKNIFKHYSLFTSSDQYLFWYPFNAKKLNTGTQFMKYVNNMNSTVRTVWFHDTGPLRGIQQKCYQKKCDDISQLTDDNLLYLATVIQTSCNSLDILMNKDKCDVFGISCITAYIIIAAIIILTLLIICCLVLYCTMNS